MNKKCVFNDLKMCIRDRYLAISAPEHGPNPLPVNAPRPNGPLPSLPGIISPPPYVIDICHLLSLLYPFIDICQ